MSLMVSIIIPVYNTEKYIGECLKSCINQTYKDFEIIVIDDKSEDSSLSIAKNILAKSQVNYTIIEKEKRSGVSNSRNLGIKASRGKYIYFLDSDDIIKSNAIEDLIKIAEENNYMVVYGGYSRNLSDIKSCKVAKTFKAYNISYYDLGPLLWAGVIWGGIINSSIIKDNNLTFNESLQYGEDTVFKIELLKYLDKLIVTDEKLYYWRIVKNSLSDNSNISEILEREYNLLQIFFSKLCKSYSRNQNTILIKMIRVKKNAIYNIINDNKYKNFDLKSIYKIRISINTILESNLSFRDKFLELFYCVFNCFDRYYIWSILYKLKKKI